jgi:hypothetical protein
MVVEAPDGSLKIAPIGGWRMNGTTRPEPLLWDAGLQASVQPEGRVITVFGFELGPTRHEVVLRHIAALGARDIGRCRRCGRYCSACRAAGHR